MWENFCTREVNVSSRNKGRVSCRKSDVKHQRKKRSQEKYMQNLSYRKTKIPEFLNISMYIVNFFPDPWASTIFQNRMTKKLPVELGIFSRALWGIFSILLTSFTLAERYSDQNYNHLLSTRLSLWSTQKRVVHIMRNISNDGIYYPLPQARHSEKYGKNKWVRER